MQVLKDLTGSKNRMVKFGGNHKMNIKRKIIIDKLNLPIENYNYDVKLLTSVDGGKNYYYCGFGKFAKTLTEAREIKKQLLAQC